MSLAAYRASSAFTISLASLAHSGTLVAGRASTSVSNATNRDEHLSVGGQIMCGTTTTAGVIEVWAFAQRADGTWPDLFTGAYSGTDAALTVRSRDVLFAGARLVGAATVGAGLTSVPFTFAPADLSALFGMPPREFALWVVHSSGVNLHATGTNHVLTLQAAHY